MLIERSMHPGYLSNAYLVADEEGGTAVFVDSGAPIEPLLAAAERVARDRRSHVLAHARPPRPRRARRATSSALPVVTGDFESGGLRFEALPCPGHSDDGVSFVVGGGVVLHAATRSSRTRSAARATTSRRVRRSVMDVLMKLPPETRVLPGHTEETTIGREWEENPFVRVWRGVDPEGTEPVRVGGEPATLVVWSPDYDGKGKAWVRFADGRDAIVGGSQVERG